MGVIIFSPQLQLHLFTAICFTAEQPAFRRGLSENINNWILMFSVESTACLCKTWDVLSDCQVVIMWLLMCSVVTAAVWGCQVMLGC